MSFLKWCRNAKDAYTDKELRALFSASTADERLWWLFALQTGAREGEIIHATWKDIDLDNHLFHVQVKDGFNPKDKTNRSIPFGQELANALRARKANSRTPLVFATKAGKPQPAQCRSERL